MFGRLATATLRNARHARGMATSTAPRSGSSAVKFAAGVGLGAAVGFTASTAAADGKNVYDLLAEMNRRLGRVEEALGVDSVEADAELRDIMAAKKAFPNNLMAKHFSMDYYMSLSPPLRKRLLKIVKSGADNADSGMGMYAMMPDDYDTFQEYMDKVIRDYHKIDGEVAHITNWDLAAVKDKLPKGGKLDLTKLGLGETSMRVRVGRNLDTYPLPGAMSKQDRINMENELMKAFDNLIQDPKFGGQYYSLTPGNPNQISEAKYNELVKAHIMFKDMAADTYLNSAGISSSWPYGRGCYVSADKGFIVWVGEEDHLRIMCMKKGTVLNDVFDRLKDACNVVEKNAGKFAHSQQYGYVTSCPTNLGTGMRASLHIKVPNLTKGGSDEKAKAVCKPLGLSVRGMGGEHTPIGADGTVDISPSARLQIQENEIVVALYQGIKNLLAEEKKCK